MTLLAILLLSLLPACNWPKDEDLLHECYESRSRMHSSYMNLEASYDALKLQLSECRREIEDIHGRP